MTTAPHAWISRWTVSLLAVATLVAYAYVNSGPPGSARVVKGDGEGYFAYIPAYVLDRDPSFARVVDRRFAGDHSLAYVKGFEYIPGSGGYLDRYPMGVAVLSLPFFAAGHIVALASSGTGDGYSPDEQLVTGLSAVVIGTLGLLALRRVLLRRFSDGVTAAALASVTLGTSLLHYMAFDSTYSHAFSFAAVSATMLAAVRWREQPSSYGRAAVLSGSLAAVLLLREANLAVVAPLILLGVVDAGSLRRRLAALRVGGGRLALVPLGPLAMLLVQHGAWSVAAGRWILDSYPHESTFDPLHPNWRVLYSFDPHGLLPYAPVLLFAIAGLVPLYRGHREWFWPVVLGLALETYLYAGWFRWPLGDGFGQRGFVDVAGVFAVPLAALYEVAWRSRARFAVAPAAATLTASTVLGSLAYWQGRIPHIGVAPAAYLRALLGG